VFAVEMTAVTEESIGAKVGSALQGLGRDFLSTLNIHAFDHYTPLDRTLGALAAVKEHGVIGRVSFSNLSDAEAALIVELDTEHVVDFVQLHGNVLERRLLNTSGKRFRANGRGVACFRALARGLLTRGYSPSNPRPEDSRSTRGWRLNSYLSNDYLQGLEKLSLRLSLAEVSPVDFALSWLINGGSADSAVVGVRNSEQLAEVMHWQAGTRAHSGGELEAFIPASLLAYVNQLPLDHFER
jgi:aryl-alcohol dehydrogenase-like predicted oxidoreductase